MKICLFGTGPYQELSIEQLPRINLCRAHKAKINLDLILHLSITLSLLTTQPRKICQKQNRGLDRLNKGKAISKLSLFSQIKESARQQQKSRKRGKTQER